jgi:isopentenyldiphosphate isomerase
MHIELVDVLTDEGLLTGRTKAKDLVHRDGDWHGAAHLWNVSSDGRVLLQRRALVKESWPGLWDVSVAGHVTAGETALAAVVRETREELGLAVDASDLSPLGRIRYHCALRPDYVENEFHDIFLLRRDVALSSLRLDPLEVADVAYVHPSAFSRYERVPHEKAYALLARAMAG